MESKVEAYYKRRIALAGGVSFKFSSPQRASVTDQITVFFGRVIFVEVKRVGKSMTEKQERFGMNILEHGGEHACVVGHSGVDLFVEQLIEQLPWYKKMLYDLRMFVRRFDGKHYR